METNIEKGEEECINCAVWMGPEEDNECFLVRDRCTYCNGRICENCVPLGNRISKSGEEKEIVCSVCRKYRQNKEEDSGILGDNEDAFEVVEEDRTFEILLEKCAGERERMMQYIRKTWKNM